MTTSGTITFSLTAQQVITFALRKINIVATTEDPSADDSARAMQELNLLLKGWAKYPLLWRLTEGSITMVNATASYVMSPTPHRVTSVRFNNSVGTDIPILLMSRGEYFDTAIKGTAGDPVNYYVDHQRASSTMYVYPVKAVVTTETLKYTFQRRIEDIADPSNDIDVRPEWLEVVGYNLAARLTMDFGVSADKQQAIGKVAGALLNEAIGDNHEDYVRAEMQATQG